MDIEKYSEMQRKIGADQVLEWSPKIGQYKTTNMYEDLRGEKQQVDWKKIFFDSYAKPCAIFTLSLTLMGRLNTKDRINFLKS